MSDLTGTSFLAADVAALYVHRAPYAEQIYGYLAERSATQDRLLDLGCGEGKIARTMALTFKAVTAVDPSMHMIALGKSLENGQAANIDWRQSTAESVTLSGQYDLVTFASSIHWMEPSILFSKLRHHLTTKHFIAIISGDEAFNPPWEEDWQQFLSEWVPRVTGRPLGSKEWTNSRVKHLEYLDNIETHHFVSAPFSQSVDSFIKCQNSRNTFTPSALGDQMGEFRKALSEMLDGYRGPDGMLQYSIKTQVTLGRAKNS